MGPINAFSLLHADTEEYLHKLASKISSVKMAAEMDKAAKKAAEDARAKVGNCWMLQPWWLHTRRYWARLPQRQLRVQA